MPPSPELIAGLRDLLDGRAEIDVLQELQVALEVQGSTKEPVPQPFALGLDASVLLNLGKGRAGVDVVDYLSARHEGPLILPAQTIYEFWNNHVGAISGVAGRLRKQFGDLSSIVEELDPAFREFARDAEALLEGFEARYGHVLEDRVAGELITLFAALADRALIPQVPRSEFAAIAVERKLARVPPGFKDNGTGDFFVWAEFLVGLRTSDENGRGFDHVVLATDDRKRDWSTRGTAHPGLCAEVKSWTGKSFDAWSLSQLQQYVQDILAAKEEGTQSGEGSQAVPPPASSIEAG